MHAISSYRGNRPTNTHTHPPTHPQANRHDRLQYTAPQLARSVTIWTKIVRCQQSKILRKSQTGAINRPAKCRRGASSSGLQILYYTNRQCRQTHAYLSTAQLKPPCRSLAGQLTSNMAGGRADDNVAAVSHGQHVPTPTAAAA